MMSFGDVIMFESHPTKGQGCHVHVFLPVSKVTELFPCCHGNCSSKSFPHLLGVVTYKHVLLVFTFSCSAYHQIRELSLLSHYT